MSAQRLRLDDPELGLAFDVTLRASAPAFFETRHQQLRHGRLLNDVLRYTQVARADGELTVDGEREAVDGRHACRDHSWGIRSTMGPHAPLGGLEQEAPDPRALRLWVPFECGDTVGFFHCHEAHDGSVLDCEGRLDRAGRAPLRIDAVGHELRYEEGTRRLAGGELSLLDETGAEHGYRFEVACAPAHPQGFGYTRGWSDGGQPGVYRGNDVIERDRFDVSDPRVAGRRARTCRRSAASAARSSSPRSAARTAPRGWRTWSTCSTRPGGRGRAQAAWHDGARAAPRAAAGAGARPGAVHAAVRARRAHDAARPRRPRRRPARQGLGRLRQP